MKTAIYKDTDNIQIVLTPEDDFEKNVIEKISNMSGEKIAIRRGHFYECRGGWVRQEDSENSLMITTVEKLKEKDNK